MFLDHLCSSFVYIFDFLDLVCNIFLECSNFLATGWISRPWSYKIRNIQCRKSMGSPRITRSQRYQVKKKKRLTRFRQEIDAEWGAQNDYEWREYLADRSSSPKTKSPSTHLLSSFDEIYWWESCQFPTLDNHRSRKHPGPEMTSLSVCTKKLLVDRSGMVQVSSTLV